MSSVQKALPLLTPENREYWTSGADGVLLVHRCPTCDQYQHPYLVVCPSCAGMLEWAPVSGSGTVVGFTVNSQPWGPGDPAYVVAIVALDEDTGVRIMANLVDLGDAAPEVGMRVAVRFEQHDDVWLPVFAPSGEPPRPVDVPEPQVSVRPMASTRKFEADVALTGIGMSQVGRRLMRPPISLAVEASLAAISDAGLEPSDIDGLSTYPGAASHRGISEGGIPALEEALRIRPTWFNGGMEIPGQGGALVAAMLAVSAGLCRHVLCVRTLWEATAAEQVRSGEVRPGGGGRVTGEMQFMLPYGAVSAAHWIGMHASQYFARYGAGRELLGRIAVNARTNAARNPVAIYRDPMTMDDYFAARMVTTPFGLYDCDVPCDGSVAIVVSAVDAARDTARPPVFVEAVGTQITERQSWDQGTLTHEPNVFGPAAHMWSRTTLSQSDVDVALLYDGFSFNCVSWLEALGFCGLGEATDFVGDGRRIAIDGELPLNPHGGQLSAGRLHGFGFIHEAVTQLRGDAGERQVAGARVAVVSTGGGTPGGVLLLRNGS